MLMQKILKNSKHIHVSLYDNVPLVFESRMVEDVASIFKLSDLSSTP